MQQPLAPRHPPHHSAFPPSLSLSLSLLLSLLLGGWWAAEPPPPVPVWPLQASHQVEAPKDGKSRGKAGKAEEKINRKKWKYKKLNRVEHTR
ncbi:hypothetical protein COCNU_01G013510 [Cocos nucifera]|uniref:Uncharacterized protein n=1 Tax=Cocos nucifera TaxID=13894 RepID=A0A8K0MV16_COCNU|nr:hypothetical protein COCNU_01G013510 [Cocos nucifera]